MTINTQNLQQQVLDDFAFHLGYHPDPLTGNYKRELYYISHSPFRRLNYNTMVTIYNRMSQATSITKDRQVLTEAIAEHFPKVMQGLMIKAISCPLPIETIYLQRSKKQNKILCHKHQIKFSSCQDGVIMKEEFENEHYDQRD